MNSAWPLKGNWKLYPLDFRSRSFTGSNFDFWKNGFDWYCMIFSSKRVGTGINWPFQHWRTRVKTKKLAQHDKSTIWSLLKDVLGALAKTTLVIQNIWQKIAMVTLFHFTTSPVRGEAKTMDWYSTCRRGMRLNARLYLQLHFVCENRPTHICNR